MLLISKRGLITLLMLLFSLGFHPLNAAEPAKETLTFIDTQSFDSEFVASLTLLELGPSILFYSHHHS